MAAECGRNFPNTEVQLTFVSSAYLMRDVFRRYEMLIWTNDSSERQSNMKELFREYLQLICLILLVVREADLR